MICAVRSRPLAGPANRSRGAFGNPRGSLVRRRVLERTQGDLSGPNAAERLQGVDAFAELKEMSISKQSVNRPQKVGPDGGICPPAGQPGHIAKPRSPCWAATLYHLDTSAALRPCRGVEVAPHRVAGSLTRA
jgi:hypothetical protein